MIQKTIINLTEVYHTKKGKRKTKNKSSSVLTRGLINFILEETDKIEKEILNLLSYSLNYSLSNNSIINENFENLKIHKFFN